MEELTTRRTDRHQGRPDRSRRTSLVILFVVLSLLIVGLVSASNYYRGCQRGVDGSGEPVEFTVPPGASAGQVVDDLHSSGVTRCGGFVGNLLMRGTGKSGDLRAGTYSLATGMSMDEAVTVLSTPPKEVPTTELLVPPGARLVRIAESVQEAFGIPEAKFLARADSGDFSLPPYLPKGTDTVEGFLFPQTYRIAKDATADEIIQILLDQFETETADLPWDNADAMGVSPYEIVNIASMIEKEAGTEKDRPLIASVIYNRLDENMALGIDATLLYPDPEPRTSVTQDDIDSDNPYNTRKYPGLPPTPIASPGTASIRAALEPAESPYFYYVLCGEDGSHRFSQTYDQHLAYVNECLGR
jgi:UPF0755 protein